LVEILKKHPCLLVVANKHADGAHHHIRIRLLSATSRDDRSFLNEKDTWVDRVRERKQRVWDAFFKYYIVVELLTELLLARVLATLYMRGYREATSIRLSSCGNRTISHNGSNQHPIVHSD
jgi:hypothetical protein